MKKFFISLLLVAVSITIYATNVNKIEVNAPIHEVKLYLNGASIYRDADISLKKGENIIRVNGVSRYVDAASIQVKMGHDVSINSIFTDIKYLSKETVYPELIELNKEIEAQEAKIMQVRNRIGAYRAEKRLLDANLSIKGDQSNLSLEELAKAADFINQRVFKISEKIFEYQTKEAKLNKEIELLRKKKESYRMKALPVQSSIVITLISKVDIKTKLMLNYLVNQAAWKPIYDVKAEDLEKPIQLTYKAKILNNTEINWENVTISCSTSDPSRGISLPNLTPWGLYLSNRKDKSYSWGYSNEGYLNTLVGTYKYGLTDSIGRMNATETIEINDLTREFHIPELQSIKSSRKPTTMELTSYELEATYKHMAIPKQDKDAFLTAGISNWQNLHLIDGTMNVYYQNAFIGQTFLNTRNIEDTLKLSLGRVQQVLVTRTKKIDESKKRLIGGTTKETLSYEIVVKNNSNKAIEIDLYDQIPIAQDSEIKVDIIEISDANLNELNGQLSWYLKLEPNTSKRIVITFSVSYPKNQDIPLRQTREINCPTF